MQPTEYACIPKSPGEGWQRALREQLQRHWSPTALRQLTIHRQRSSPRALLAEAGGSHLNISCQTHTKRIRHISSPYPGAWVSGTPLKTHTVTHPSSRRARLLSLLLTLHRKATCFINTKASARAKRASLTTCHFTSAGTCHRVTQ